MIASAIDAYPDRQSFYRSLLPKIRETAKARGYAIGVHGSETRDFDLIAAPWTAEAIAPDDLARAVADAVEGHLVLKAAGQLAGIKPLGRRAYTITWGIDVDERYPHPGHWGVFIDMSVAPIGLVTE